MKHLRPHSLTCGATGNFSQVAQVTRTHMTVGEALLSVCWEDRMFGCVGFYCSPWADGHMKGGTTGKVPKH